MRTRSASLLLLSLWVFGCSSEPKEATQPPGDEGDETPKAETFTYSPPGCDYTLEIAEGRGLDYALDDGTLGDAPAPQRVRIGLGGTTELGKPGYADPSKMAAFVWETDVNTKASKVRMGPSPDALTEVYTGFSYALPGSVPVRIHQVHVCNGKPGETWYYQVGGGPEGGEVWGPVQSFTFTPAGGSNETVTIGVSGDARDSHDVVWPLVQSRMKDAAPTLQVFTGDAIVIPHEASARDYARWLDGAWKSSPSSPGGDFALGNHPFYPIGGNHENLQIQWLSTFAFPGSGKYQGLFFSFDAGPIHVVLIDDGPVSARMTARWPGAEEAILSFLENDLAKANERRDSVPWIVIFHHRGALSTSNHGNDHDVKRMRTLLMPLWDKYNVTAVINGHDHNYERSAPSTWSGSEPVPMEELSQGTTHIVCAGAGADGYSTGDGSEPWSLVRQRYGKDTPYVGLYGFLSATPDKLTWKAYGLKPEGTKVADDDEIDSVEWTR